MPEPAKTVHVSVITTATIRVAGKIPTDITLNHLGTPEQEASLRVGELLIYLRSAFVAQVVADVWRQGRPIAGTLPYALSPGRLRLPVRVGMVGMMVRLGGHPPCTVVPVPARPGGTSPAHVRVEIGPLVWEVCDAAAWHSIGTAWTTLARQLAATED
jgi:hypothetical protein